MKFSNKSAEKFETEGTTFTFNHDRTEYTANEILDQYEGQIKKIAKKYKKTNNKDKKVYHGRNILSLHSEWHVEGSEETLYLVYTDDGECFTEVTTDNEYYVNGGELS